MRERKREREREKEKERKKERERGREEIERGAKVSFCQEEFELNHGSFLRSSRETLSITRFNSSRTRF